MSNNENGPTSFFFLPCRFAKGSCEASRDSRRPSDQTNGVHRSRRPPRRKNRLQAGKGITPYSHIFTQSQIIQWCFSIFLKESESETFKIRDENPWVTVEPNGAVRVKKRWDFEELGREKTIDFWVIISNVRSASECTSSISKC